MTIAVLLWLLSFAAVGGRPAGARQSTASCPPAIAGVVVEATGDVVAHAKVLATSPDGNQRTTQTDRSGRFHIALPVAGQVSLLAREGSRRAAVAVAVAPCATTEVELVVQEATFSEQVDVGGSQARRSSLAIPASVSVVGADRLASSSSPALDDVLRSVPNFSLFRRSSSRTANPTSQGVSLRGLNGSGASRGLVVAEGIPLNDPFGGWVYWDRVPTIAIDRVEVIRGGWSNEVGADAVGGLIRIVTARSPRPEFRASSQAGSGQTRDASLFGGTTWHGFELSGAGQLSRTEGFFTLAAPDRGAVDTPAGADYETLWVSVGRRSHGEHAIGVRAWGNMFGERRANGTREQRNATGVTVGAVEASGIAGGGSWLARGFVQQQRYRQTFSAIAADRSTEQLLRTQEVPGTGAGVLGTWHRPFRSTQALIGVEARKNDATSNEVAFASVNRTNTVATGGALHAVGAFAQASTPLGARWLASVGARADVVTVQPGAARFRALSPRASVVWQVQPGFALRASAFQAFRAPTLNELYRDFRVGNVLTRANPQLGPERFTGFEGAASWTFSSGAIRLVAHRGQLNSAVTNVTLSQAPATIVRQRRNAGSIRATGIELEAETRAARRLVLEGSAALGDSRFASGALDNRVVPLFSRYQFSVSARYVTSRTTLGASLLATGPQFEDDLNLLPLGRAVVAGAFASRNLTSAVSLFGSVDNLFNTQYDVGRTPWPTIGLPRTGRIGVRVVLGR